MRFLREPNTAAAVTMAHSIRHALRQNEHVLWLVSGGSNIPVEIAVMRQLREDCPELLDDLMVLPMDERYGPSGHQNSNYQQMLEAGFAPGDAHWYDVLIDDLPLAETVDYYVDLAEETFGVASYVIGTFGMGADGHTAGILPRSPAAFDTEAVVVGYTGPDHVRMTLTQSVLVRCNEAFLLAYGETKQDALHNLEAAEHSIDDMPAQILHHIENVTVYNDSIATEEAP